MVGNVCVEKKKVFSSFRQKEWSLSTNIYFSVGELFLFERVRVTARRAKTPLRFGSFKYSAVNILLPISTN